MSTKSLYRIVSFVCAPPITLALTLVLATTSISTALIVLAISFAAPGFYFIALEARHKIDTDVKDKGKRMILFMLEIAGLSIAYIVVLFTMNAPKLAATILALVLISLLFAIILKIFRIEWSYHIAGITVLMLFLGIFISPFSYIVTIPILVLTAISRYRLNMHTISELVLGFLGSLIIFLIVMSFV